MSIFSAVTVAALIAGILLVIAIPPSDINHHVNIFWNDEPHKKANDVVVFIYSLILILTLLLVVWYVLFKAFQDRDLRIKQLEEESDSYKYCRTFI